jgi:hypothetical protein
MNQLRSKNFLPIDISNYTPPLGMKWLNIEDDPFDGPFFDENTEAYVNKHTPNVIETSLSEVIATSQIVDCVSNKAFIFHMSRCGSTLLCNMFKQINKTIVHSEPWAPVHLCELYTDANREYIDLAFRASVEMLGRRRFPYQENMVIKWFSGLTHHLPAVNRAFPDVPRIYLYRDPVEVLMSNLQDADQGWIYNPTLTRQTRQQTLEENTPLENCAYALAYKSQAFIDNYDERSLIVNYNQIGRELLELLVRHFKFDLSPAEIDQMIKARECHSKNINVKFAADTKEKQRNASPKLRSVAERIMGPVHEQLEKMKIQI